MVAGILFVATALFGTMTLQRQLNPTPENTKKMRQKLNRYWVNFRGPHGNGTAVHENVPVSWNDSTGAGIRWKTEVPLQGNSSPVVYKNRIFLTGATRKSREVYCFNARNGKITWRREVKVETDSTLKIPKVDRETGYAAPTPACDGKRVYAIFATGELASFNLRGKQIWSRHLGAIDNHYGHSSSLITHNGMLFVQYDQYDVGKLLAIDGKTGETLWEAKRTRLSWSSPICVNTGKRYELILTDNETVTSYNPATGEILWSHACLYGEVGPSAAYTSGMVIAANEYAVAAGIDISNPGPDGVPPIKWEWRGSLPNTSSPVAQDSLLFLATAAGTLTCLHAGTGKEIWYKDFDEGFYSSPVIAGNNVYLIDRKGKAHVFEVADQYREVATSILGENTDTTPAILDGFIIIRGQKHLFRIDGV